MIKPHHLVNPIIQGETGDTLAHCSDCLAYLAESIGVLHEGEVSPNGFIGLQMLLDSVRAAIDYEHQRLNEPDISIVSN
ncbi:MAG: hypothetical protein ACI9D5_000821 [Candidatus Endobugula sp.]|jgi:hypothetical protein